MYINFNFRSYAPLIHSSLVFIPRFLCNYSMYVLLLYTFPHFHSIFIPYLSDFISSLRLLLLLLPLLKFFNLFVLLYFPSFLDLCDWQRWPPQNGGNWCGIAATARRGEQVRSVSFLLSYRGYFPLSLPICLLLYFYIAMCVSLSVFLSLSLSLFVSLHLYIYLCCYLSVNLSSIYVSLHLISSVRACIYFNLISSKYKLKIITISRSLCLPLNLAHSSLLLLSLFSRNV